MPQRSAGILLYRLTAAAPEALPVHPGGPFWAKNDGGAWSIPVKTQSRACAGDRLGECGWAKATQCTTPMRKLRSFRDGVANAHN
jgi:predicted NUDIX family NTP pyrophosphohydrolase